MNKSILIEVTNEMDGHNKMVRIKIDALNFDFGFVYDEKAKQKHSTYNEFRASIFNGVKEKLKQNNVN